MYYIKRVAFFTKTGCRSKRRNSSRCGYKVPAGRLPSCKRGERSVLRRWLLAPKRSSKTLAAGRPHCRTRASCWKRLERENVHASVGLADVWTVLERGLLLDRLKRARRRDPRSRRKDGAGVWAWRDIFRHRYDLPIYFWLRTHNLLARAGIHFN